MKNELHKATAKWYFKGKNASLVVTKTRTLAHPNHSTRYELL